MNEAIHSPDLISMLIEIMKQEKHPVNWRAAWIVDHIAHEKLELIDPYLTELVEFMQITDSNSIKRHIIRMLAYSKRKDLMDGNIVNISFQWLQSSTTPIAVKVFCMDIISLVASDYPELITEFLLVLDDITKTGSAGEKNKASKLIIKYAKQGFTIN